jgi:hypothetical protein
MELKVFEVGLGKMLEDGSPTVIAVDEKNSPRLLGNEKVYLKSEADKVIAHQKYKRCLAMAKLCRSEWAAAIFIPEKGGTDKQAALYMKWEKRWLKLAEKFKEAK